MTHRLEVDDLRLVDAVARHGSIGSAAKELLITQPSASRRLSALERLLGTTLFDRNTTGARVTPAGRELARRAVHVLSELDALPSRVLAAVNTPTLVIGTTQSLSPMVFTALDIELDAVTVQPEIDHGPTLMQNIAAGSVDAAIITIAEQAVIPKGLTRNLLGKSPLVMVVPENASFPSRGGRRPLTGQTVIYNTLDLAGESVHHRLSSLGAHPRPGATIEASLRCARHHGCLAIVPELAARWYADPGDRITVSPLPGTVTVSLVSRPPTSEPLMAAIPKLSRRILCSDGDSCRMSDS